MNKPLYYSRFHEVFIPYMKYWDDWIISDYCFLTASEIEAVAFFQKHPSVEALAAHLNRSTQTIRTKIKRIIRKLHLSKKVFDEWVKKYKAGTDQQDYPLHVPVTCLPVSTRLKTIIYQVGNSLHDAFINTQGDLKKLRRFGSGNQQELDIFLQSCGINFNELILATYAKKEISISEDRLLKYRKQQQSLRLPVQETVADWPGGKVCRIASGCCMVKQEGSWV